MALYTNGEVPRSSMVLLASGTNGDGYWEHLAPPSTARKIAALVKIGQDRSGRTLQVTPGWNIYRPVEAQWTAYRNQPAGNAAYPRTSSHGGTYNGADAMAIDFANWQYVFGTYAAFAAACREVGLTPGVFGWELWHVFDYAPWAAVPSGSISTPVEDDMYDNEARAELLWEIACLRPIKLYALVDANGAGGWIWVGPSGRWWNCPSGAYAQLVDAQKLSQGRPIRGMQQDEFNFLTKQLLPLGVTDAEEQLEQLISLDEGTVARIVAGLGDVPVSLSQSQLDAIAAAATAGASAGGAAGAKAAIAGLSFVVSAS